MPNPAYDGPENAFQRGWYSAFWKATGSGCRGVQSGDLDMTNLPFPLWGAAAHLHGIYKVRKWTPQENWYFISINFRNPRGGVFPRCAGAPGNRRMRSTNGS